MNFRVGQKVCCVNDVWVHYNWAFIPNRPRKNGIYTIRAFDRRCSTGLRILLAEMKNPKELWDEGYSEGSFPVSRFRPLVEKKTDISIFTHMLTDTEQKVTA